MKEITLTINGTADGAAAAIDDGYVLDMEAVTEQTENCMGILEPYGIGMSEESLIYGCSFFQGNEVVCLFRLNEEEEEMQNRLYEFAERVKINSQNGTIAISSLNYAGSSVEKAYSQARYIMQSGRQLMVSGTLFFDEIRERVKENARDNKDDGLVQQVRNSIEQYYAEPDLTIEMLCGKLGKSVSYLSKIYKERTGQNILYDLNLVRIEKARQFLREENASIDEVGRRVGFTSSNSFIRVFKKYENVTPGRYKEMYLAGMIKD